jgi:putative SOS response-associated peptidase YedK
MIRSPAEYAAAVGAASWPEAKPRYNLAPSQTGLVAREHPETGQRELVALKWGLVPHWAADTKVGYKMINTRSETAASKPAFRDGMKYRRCLVAADGWYEWQVTLAGKVPTFIQRVGDGGEVVPVFFAGLWASWRPKDQPDADWLEAFTILTREASPELQIVHDRMPVILPVSAYSTWLDRGTTSGAAAAEMLAAAVVEGFHHYPVSTLVNTPKNDRPECMAAVVGE